MARKPASKDATSRERRKLIAFDEETWHAVDLLARDTMSTIQELADEAFRDLLRKHNRPVDLKTALRQSARGAAGEGSAAATGRKRTSE
jgi:S-methylmethionine-dependent homocysteine/selenocysteine methylase